MVHVEEANHRSCGKKRLFGGATFSLPPRQLPEGTMRICPAAQTPASKHAYALLESGGELG